MSRTSDSTTRIAGVYIIRCLTNGKIYIGSSVHVHKRWSTHRRALHKNRHFNKSIQNAWNKYGENAFTFEILECCERDITLLREQYWLDTLKPFGEQGFNIATDASAPTLGRKLSPAERDQLREAGKKRPPFFKGKHHSLESRMKISAAGKGRHLSPESREKLSASKMGKRPGEATRVKLSAAHKNEARQISNERTRKKYIVITPDGTEIEIKGLNRFCSEHGLLAGKMSNVARGKQTNHKGWKCRYDKE